MPAPISLENLFASADASIHFALACLEPAGISLPADVHPSAGKNLRAKSSFVDPDGAIMHWHDFGDLEGPGWAANAVGGAHLLYRWGEYVKSAEIQGKALRLLDHVLEDGFIRPDGFIYPYWHLTENRFCLNYRHNNDWLCPGSLAKIGVQMLEFASDLAADQRASTLQQTAENLAGWLEKHVPLVESERFPGRWMPRRITIEGQPYPLSPHSTRDPVYDHSADGLFLLHLWALTGRPTLAQTLGDTFVAAGGLWGSINHDTFDDHENVAYAVAFRVLRQIAERLERSHWREFACQVALPAMQRFRMDENRNGVTTCGLFWMEESWDTAYLWENAEVAQAHLEAWLDDANQAHLEVALDVLTAIAQHHYGSLGFLTEGVDWNNHVGQQHHIYGDLYGAIQYTEPLLNNLHLVGPTLTCLRHLGSSKELS